MYKSLDGGQSFAGWPGELGTCWQDLDRPRDSNVVYAAAQGPLWAPGGDRGLYKTTDGGATWTLVLNISENTGVSDVVLDPRNPDVLLAHRLPTRRRHVVDSDRRWTRIRAAQVNGRWCDWRRSDGLPGTNLVASDGHVADQPDVVYAWWKRRGSEGASDRRHGRRDLGPSKRLRVDEPVIPPGTRGLPPRVRPQSTRDGYLDARCRTTVGRLSGRWASNGSTWTMTAR